MGTLNHSFKMKLALDGVSSEVISSLESAVVNASSACLEAGVYADHMETAYSLYGLDGVKTQVLYMLCNLRNWKGEEARNAKKVLNKFVK